MSWNVFKNNVLRYADNPKSIINVDQIANLYAVEYDMAIRRGRDSLHGVSVLNTNLPALIQSFQTSFRIGLNSGSSFSLINQIETGIISYWSGAILQPLPIPLIPAPGSVANIAVTSNSVTSPGTWTKLPTILPSNSTHFFIDMFISAAITHLTTISGIVNTISLYPSATGTVPGPGVIYWNGYVV